MADNVVAAPGEILVLLVGGDEPLQGEVKASFQLFDTGADGIVRAFWDEVLKAEPPKQGDPPEVKARVPWKVNIDGSLELPPKQGELTFRLFGSTGAGRPLRVLSGNRLLIPAEFGITEAAKLQRLMLHEFSKASGPQDFVLDEAPLREVLDGLTPQQVRILAGTDPGPSGNRLVSFITIQNENDLRMNADTSQNFAQAMKANATYTTFHCQGPGKPVSLVCHTRHAVFNMLNTATRNLVNKPQGGKPPDEWLSRSNPTPPVFKMGCFLNLKTAGVPWIRLFTAKGKPIMGTNTIHGTINTDGCWMLFRNYNWPKQKARELEDIYIRKYRHNPSFKEIVKLLEAQGYDQKADPRNKTISERITVGSPDKWLQFDANNAYIWYFRDVIGLRYFSPTYFGNQLIHDRNIHGEVFESDFKLQDALDFSEANGDPNTVTGSPKFICHDLAGRLKIEKGFKATDDLFGENALGFQATQGFTVPSELPASQVQERTWGDLYIYRADDIKVKDFKPAYFG